MPASDKIFMARALELAENGAGLVSPNPLVGAVIVQNNIIMGVGWHARYGEKHAEVAALENALSKNHDVHGATLYVTLEPCNHTGHQPPCTAAIIQSGIAKVVYAIPDPNPAVAGGGATLLQKNGLNVESGLCADEATEQNKIWLHWITTKIPYVCVKVAATEDQKITRTLGTATQISGPDSQRFSHGLRQRYDAILVGANTVAIDKPALSNRSENLSELHQPFRIVVDGHLKIPLDAAVLRDAHCIVLTSTDAPPAKILAVKKKTTVVILPAENGRITIANILRELGRRFITSVLIEGGAEILQQFFDTNSANEWLIVRSPQTFDSGLDFISHPEKFTSKYILQKTIPAGNDTIECYLPLENTLKKE